MYLNNSFEVNNRFIENLPHLLRNNDESSWQKTSVSLDASAKIYGFRVDLVHNETYRMLGCLDRAKDKNDQNNEELGIEQEVKSKKNKVKIILYITNRKLLKI